MFVLRTGGALLLAFPFAALAIAQVDVLTHHNDVARTGANLREQTLNTSNVKNGSFGKLVSRIVDGDPYAQPLIVTGAKAAGRAPTDLVIVATEHNSVYAFDAEDVDPASTTAQVWHTGPDQIGAPVPSARLYRDIGLPTCQGMTPEVGITSTPAIQLTKQDAPKEGVIFTVAKSWSNGRYSYSLLALDLASGGRLSRTVIQGEAPGTGIGHITVNGKSVIRFNAEYELNRPALLLSGNTLIMAFGGHCDQGPYHGWIFAYDVSNATAPRLMAVFCASPNGRHGENEGRNGIWMSGAGPALDKDGSIYFSIGDGTYNGTTDFGDSILRMRIAGGAFQIEDWFTPANYEFLMNHDVDLGSGGPVLVPETHVLLEGGKEGRIFLIDRDKMGKGKAPPIQSIQVTHQPDGPYHYYNLHGSSPIWKSEGKIFVYTSGEENPFNQYRLVPDGTAGSAGWKFDPPDGPYKTTADCPRKPACLSAPYPNYPLGVFGDENRSDIWMPGAFMTVSANGGQRGSGILWAASPLGADATKRVVRGVLRAFNASDISQPELWDSESTGDKNDRLGQFAKFCPPTIANGKVYMVTFQQEIVTDTGAHRKAPPPADQAALVIYGLKGKR